MFFIWPILAVFFFAPAAEAAPAADRSGEEMIEFFAADTEPILLPRKKFSEWFDIGGKLIYDPSYRGGVEDPYGALPCPNKHPLCRELISSRYAGKAFKQVKISPRRQSIEGFLRQLSEQIAREPKNARLVIENGRAVVFSQSSPGRRLDIEGSFRTIAAQKDLLSRGLYPQRIKLTVREIPPAVGEDSNARDLGIVKLLAEGRSNFAGSPSSRVHNIKVAAARFNGVILAPGEELSFVDLLGPVDASAGYRKELVIINNQTRPEYGGGVCQVSTTLFRAAILAGLEITERRSHSYAVRYYEPIGFDATVYIPKPDLRFRNNTPGHILIQNSIEGTELVFRIYGTDDGRQVEMKGPFITAYNSDNSPKKAYFTRLVKDGTGKIIFDETFYSNYKSPKDYPKPGDIAKEKRLTRKPPDWSKKQWKKYLSAGNTN